MFLAVTAEQNYFVWIVSVKQHLVSKKIASPIPSVGLDCCVVLNKNVWYQSLFAIARVLVANMRNVSRMVCRPVEPENPNRSLAHLMNNVGQNCFVIMGYVSPGRVKARLVPMKFCAVWGWHAIRKRVAV